jgi:uncharacterized Tic20 family protein
MPNDEFSSQRPPARRREEDRPILEALPAEPIAPTSEERTLAVVCHIGGFFTSFLLPLVLWLTKKEESPFVGRHAKEALNLQLFLGALYLLEVIAACVVVGVGLTVGMSRTEIVIWSAVGGGILVVLTLYETVVVILASIAGWRGRPFRTPGIFRFIR